MPDLLIADDLETALGKDFGGIPQVRHVLAERVDGPLLVWIAVDNPEASVRKRIYQKELELIDGFPEIDFDFNLVPASGDGTARGTARRAATRSLPTAE